MAKNRENRVQPPRDPAAAQRDRELTRLREQIALDLALLASHASHAATFAAVLDLCVEQAEEGTLPDSLPLTAADGEKALHRFARRLHRLRELLGDEAWGEAMVAMLEAADATWDAARHPTQAD